jgi:phosphatidylglycerophosphatase C
VFEFMATFSPIAVFDFDHTLTNRDSLLPFLFYMHGVRKSVYRLITLSPVFIRFLVGKMSRQGIKEKILTRFLGGRQFSDVQALGECYAEKQLDGYLKPEAIQRLAWHQSLGHRCLLVSASLEFYLKPWAKRHGFEEVLASRLELTSNGIVTGRLAGLNCWGLEKKQRLLAYLGEERHDELYVYGDSCGDKEILALADYPFYRKFQ